MSVRVSEVVSGWSRRVSAAASGLRQRFVAILWTPAEDELGVEPLADELGVAAPELAWGGPWTGGGPRRRRVLLEAPADADLHQGRVWRMGERTVSEPQDAMPDALTPRSGAAIAERNRCRCGRGPHPEIEGRCAAGHPSRGLPGPALVTGATSVAFWEANAEVRRAIAAAVLRDAGHTAADAPETLRLAADSIAMAALVQQSAFLHVVETGGPLTTHGRTRRAFAVWLQATDRLEKFLRLVGLRRLPRPVPTLDEALAAMADGGATEETR